MTRYHVDVTGKSKEEVNTIANKIRQAFPQLTGGYSDYYYDMLMNCTFYDKTLCWKDTGDFLCWGGDKEMFPNEYKINYRFLGEM